MAARGGISGPIHHRKRGDHRRAPRARVVCCPRPPGRHRAARPGGRAHAGQGDLGAGRDALRLGGRDGRGRRSSGGQPGVRRGRKSVRDVQRRARAGGDGVDLPRRARRREGAVRHRTRQPERHGHGAGRTALCLQPVRWPRLPRLRGRTPRGIRLGTRHGDGPGVRTGRRAVRRGSLGHDLPRTRRRALGPLCDAAAERGGVPPGDGTRRGALRHGTDALHLRLHLPDQQRQRRGDRRDVWTPPGPGV